MTAVSRTPDRLPGKAHNSLQASLSQLVSSPLTFWKEKVYKYQKFCLDLNYTVVFCFSHMAFNNLDEAKRLKFFFVILEGFFPTTAHISSRFWSPHFYTFLNSSFPQQQELAEY